MPPVTINGVTREVRAVVFDKDGTLVDFGGLWGAVARERIAAVVARAPAAPDLAAELARATGLLAAGGVDPHSPLATASRKEEEIIAAGVVYRHTGLAYVRARALCQEAFTAVDEEALVRRHTRPLPGVPETLQRLRREGFLLGIASTDTTANIGLGSRLLGIEALIGTAVGADLVARGKPAPDMLLLAAANLGVAPGEVIMVGDGVVDLQMGRNAGAAFTVGVRNGLGRAEQLRPLADLLLAGLHEWP